MLAHQISKLLKLHASLEWKLQLGTLDDDVGEIQLKKIDVD